MFIRSLKINQSLTLKSHSVFDEAMMTQIVITSQDLEHPLAFSALYPFSLFEAIKYVSRHLASAYVIFSNNMAIFLVKWSKTNQFSKMVVTISIPSLPKSPLCLVAALKALIHQFLVLRMTHCFLSLSMAIYPSYG